MLAWLRETLGHNLFDLDVLRHSTTFTLCAYDASGPLLFVPVQQPFLMESLAIRPTLDDTRKALALARITEALITDAHRRDVGEIYLHGHDDRTIKFAARHEFREIMWPFFRINLRELESI